MSTHLQFESNANNANQFFSSPDEVIFFSARCLPPEPEIIEDPARGNILTDIHGVPITICACADPYYIYEPGRPAKRGKAKREKTKPEEERQTQRAARPEATRSRRPSLSRRTEPAANSSPRQRLKFTAKRLGEIAEAKFLAQAADLGFTVLKPWGDSEPYDFVLDSRRHGRLGFSRIQLKSAHRKGKGDKGYSFSAHDFSLHAYTARDIDALIAFVVPVNAYYIIPIADLRGARGLHLFPTSKHRRSKYEKFRNAWHLLTKPPKEE